MGARSLGGGRGSFVAGTWGRLALVAGLGLTGGCSASGGSEGTAGDGGGDGPGGGFEDPRDGQDEPGAADPGDPGSDPGADDPTGPTGYDVDPPDEGQVFGVLELAAPEAEEFVLHGTLPIAKGLFPAEDGNVPFAVVDHDGQPVPSQVEAVTWYPDAGDGADVVEILALVRRAPGEAPGDRVRYPVVLSHHEPPEVAPAPTLASLKETTHGVPPSIQGLLDEPETIVVRARDCFGNLYEYRPLTAESARLVRGGRAATQVVTYGSLLPAPAVSGSQGTLPHLFGVHAYVGTRTGESVLTLDLRFTNGHVDLDPSTAEDDALGKVYFESLELVVPAGWLVQHAYPDPGVGERYADGGETVYPLVKPLTGGKMNLMPWQAQFHRRLAVSPEGKAEEARALLDLHGQAFCVRGVDPESGDDLYSWWNPGTARYFQQRSLLPSLDHIGLDSIRQDLAGDLAYLAGAVASGSSEGSYPIVAGHMGWAHPWGVAYGGMTGGDEIQFFEGVETACSGSNEGLRYFQVLHRMATDRQPTAAYRDDGVPTSVEDWLATSPIEHVPFNHFMVPNGGSDPFGVNDSPGFQRSFVENTGKQPHFEDFLLSFDPQDFQHYSRHTRAPMALTWLGNDPLAKDDLRMSAEAFRLSFHQYANNAGGGTQGSGMRSKIDDVAVNPGIGAPLGRGEGHGTACVNAAYAIADPEWRADVLPWYLALVELTADAQSTCNGFLQSIVINKGLDGKYRVRQAIEQYIYDNAMRGVALTVLRDVAPAHEALLVDFMRDSLYASISELAWQAGHNDPWSWTAVGPLHGAPYCDPSELPPDWHETWHEGHNTWSSFGYGYELTGDTVFFDFADKSLNGPFDPLTDAMDDGLYNLDNRAATLAQLQLAGGLL